ASAAAIIIWLGIAAWNGFGEGRVSEYIRSPGGTNTAVVIDNGAEVAFPLRARFFYECGREGKDVLQHESWTYEWIGENTLEFHVKMFDGEIVTERVNF
ncbi:MAG: hypothetical protein FWC27_01270, partial [Firmicutes bacterium]|nr:hypothetical protein [Bacillota bacterium]